MTTTPAHDNQHSDITALSFEDAMQELEVIVRKLETGESSLDESLKDYARGTALKGHCQKRLQEARLKVEKIVQGDGDIVSAEPFDAVS